MEAVYFTLVAAGLYIFSDRLLDFAEHRAGRRFENRTLIFFAIITVLAIGSFTLLRRLLD